MSQPKDPTTAEHKATSLTLITLCARTLHSSRDPDAAKLALSCVLACIDPSHTPPEANPDDAAELQSISDAAKDALKLPPRSALASTFIFYHYRRWVAALLDFGLPNWYAALTSADAAALFDSHFVNAPPRDSFAALVHDLSNERTGTPADDRRCSVCASILVSMVKAGKVRLLLSEQIESQPRSTADEEYDNTMLATMLFSIPERVANATRAAPPPILAPSTFFRNLATDLLKALPPQPGPPPPRARKLGGYLIGRIAKLGHFKCLIPVLLPKGGWKKGSEDASRWSAMLSLMTAGGVESAIEAAVIHVGEGKSTIESLITLFLPLIRTSTAARLALTERLLLLRVLPIHALPPLYKLSKALDRPEMLYDNVLGVAEAWNSKMHVQRSSLRQQKYLTHALLEGLKVLEPEQASNEELTRCIMLGVQLHLGAPGEPTRKLGMRVGEVASVIIDPNNPLKFDIDSGSEDEEDH